MKLLRQQKNDLFGIVQDSKHDISSFELIENPAGAHTFNHVRYKFESFEFKIVSEVNSSLYECYYSPSATQYSEVRRRLVWNDVLNLFSHWLDYLDDEISVEDKWKRLGIEINAAKDISQSSNGQQGLDKFSVIEFEVLRDKLLKFKEELTSLDFNQNQLLTFESKIDSLLIQAKSLNKFDWKSLFIGTIVSIILQLSLSQDQGKQLWELIKRIFSNFLLN